jgi:hypothetical protein
MVVVSSAIVEFMELKGVKMEGVRLRHWGWTIVEPITANAAKVSVFHTCVPQVVDYVIDRSDHIQSVMEVLGNNLARQLEMDRLRLENNLLTPSASQALPREVGGVNHNL